MSLSLEKVKAILPGFHNGFMETRNVGLSAVYFSRIRGIRFEEQWFLIDNQWTLRRFSHSREQSPHMWNVCALPRIGTSIEDCEFTLHEDGSLSVYDRLNRDRILLFPDGFTFSAELRVLAENGGQADIIIPTDAQVAVSTGKSGYIIHILKRGPRPIHAVAPKKSVVAQDVSLEAKQLPLL